MKKIVISLCVGILLSACTRSQGTFTIISNRNVNLDNVNLLKMPVKRNVEGSSVEHTVVIIPFGEMNPNISSALEDGCSIANGDVFVNAEIKESSFYIPYLYGRSSVTVKGDVLKIKN